VTEPFDLRGDSAADARQRALALMQTRRYDDALDLLGRTVARFPDDWPVRLELARCLLEVDRPADAQREAELALTRAPDAEWAHRVRALALIRLDRTGEAVQAARTAVMHAPSAALTHVMLSQALRADRQFEAARDEALDALQLAPGDTAPYESLGRSYLSLGQNDDAERAFRHVVAMTPDDPVALNNLALALQRQRREREAVELFARAAALDPREPLYRRNVGVSAGRLSGSVVPVGAALIFGLIINWIAGAIALVVFVGWRAARRRYVRRTAKGSDGQPLPDGIWHAYDDYRRARRRRATRVVLDPRQWVAIIRHPLRADPADVMHVLVVVMVAGFGLVLLGAYLGADSATPSALSTAFLLVGVGLAMVTPLGIFATTRQRRRPR